MNFMNNIKVKCSECKGEMVTASDSAPPHYCAECGGKEDWTRSCYCGAKPVVLSTGMCGPCTFGEADTAVSGEGF
jgi:hypothetical protein